MKLVPEVNDIIRVDMATSADPDTARVDALYVRLIAISEFWPTPADPKHTYWWCEGEIMHAKTFGRADPTGKRITFDLAMPCVRRIEPQYLVNPYSEFGDGPFYGVAMAKAPNAR